jgi:uncharacterized membrane protein
LFVVSLGLLAPGVALAQGTQVRLALLPVGQAGPYFDLTMEPGTARSLEVSIANDGETATAARTYAADVYTIVNGGFGGRLRDQVQTGTTDWIDYPTGVLQLAPGENTRRHFAVSVPANTGPGEYITSLILENDQPITADGSVGLNQIYRQAVAVVVTVPGLRSPGLAIGAANHEVVTGTSTVAVEVQNTGNVRLKPTVGFTLFDPGGAAISQATVPMDTFYANTSTTMEFPLAALLSPGHYTVTLTLHDGVQRADAEKSGIPLIVEATVDPPAAVGTVPGLIGVNQGTGEGSRALLGVLLLAGTLFAIGLVAFTIRRHRRQRATKTPVI